MARPTAKKKNPLSKAIIELRTRLGENQQSFSSRLGLSIVTVSRWERNFRPQNSLLCELRDLARAEGHADLAQIFDNHVAMTAEDLADVMQRMKRNQETKVAIRADWEALDSIIKPKLEKKIYGECAQLMNRLVHRYNVALAEQERLIQAGTA